MSGPQLQDVFDNVRIPFYEPTRVDSLTFRSSVNDVNRMYWNCFPVANEDKSEIWVQARDGISEAPFGIDTSLSSFAGVEGSCMHNLCITQLTDFFVAAMYDFTSSAIRIIVYRPKTGVNYVIGTLLSVSATDNIYLTELNVGNTPTIGIVYHNQDSTNSKAYYSTYNSGTSTFGFITQITDADFPTQIATPDHLVGPMVQLNGTTYVMSKAGNIYGSDLNSITSWNALNVIQAIQYPDLGVGLCRFKHYLVAFGNDTIEFFYDAGNPAPSSPLQRTDQAFIKFGCFHARSFINVDDKLYWLARSTSGTTGLWMLEGDLSPKPVSGLFENILLTNFTSEFSLYGPHSARLWPFFNNGKKHLAIGTPTTTVGLLGNSTTAFTGDTNSLSYLEFNHGIPCMTLDDHQFWFFKSGFDTDGHYFFPMFVANYESYGSGLPLSDQYCPGAFIGPTWNRGTEGNHIAYISGSYLAGNSLADYLTSSSLYAVGIQLSAKDFGNSKLKRIHALTITQRGLTSASSAATLWLKWSRNDNTSSSAGDMTATLEGSRSITIPITNNRFNFKRLGIGRSWTFAIGIKSNSRVAFKELELMISQGVR